MDQNIMLLGDAARHLGVKCYRIEYALKTGLVPEPLLRIAGKRIFQSEDIARLSAHFGRKDGLDEGRIDGSAN